MARAVLTCFEDEISIAEVKWRNEKIGRRERIFHDSGRVLIVDSPSLW